MATSPADDGDATEQPPASLPESPLNDQMVPVMDDPQMPERRRFCTNPECRHPVGRSRQGRPGLVEGFCPRCRTRFSFRPPLRPGELVGAGQFQVQGAIGYGGLGWVYRAWDCRVKRWVVLKGLIDPDDPDNRQAAIAELRALAHARHRNIVTVHTVVTHPHPLIGRDVDYIVMEYVFGKSLKQLCEERPDSDPYLPVDQVCSYTLEVLAALDHLHVRHGLLHCDVSADNVIDSADGVKLIDLGAVRQIDDQEGFTWGKRGYEDPEIETNGPSVATDLYSVARMMAVLSFPFPGFSTNAPIPDPGEVKLLDLYPSFAGLLRRATNPDPHQRFVSAAAMAEQLDGVLREIRAVREGRPFPAISTHFGPELRVVGTDPDSFPAVDPIEAALALPDSQVDPADPHVGLLSGIRARDPREIVRVLTELVEPSLATRLRVVRSRIELRHAVTGADLDVLAREHPGDWRVDWYRGLYSLVEGKIDVAQRHFTAVLDPLPGQAAPKLALALCAACKNAPELAARYYATVWRTDHSYVSAAFGLARARFVLDDITGAVTALEAVPEGSRYAPRARLCAILARARKYADGQPPVADFFTAAEELTTLELDEPRRERAVTEVLEAVLRWVHAGRPWPAEATTQIPITLLGHQLDERGVRDRLERAYLRLARLASTPMERIVLVDRANACRNRSWR